MNHSHTQVISGENLVSQSLVPGSLGAILQEPTQLMRAPQKAGNDVLSMHRGAGLQLQPPLAQLNLDVEMVVSHIAAL